MRLLLLLLLFYACTEHSAAPAKPVPTAATTPSLKDTVQKLNPVLSIAQMDSFIHLKGGLVTTSLWKLINVDRVAGMPDTLGVISGNLDEDAEKEMVIWYRVNVPRHWNGEVMFFDKRGQDWHFVGETDLDFWPAPWLSRVGIDLNLGMLLIYDYGWGSSQVESDGLRFWQCKGDSLIQVLDLTLREVVRQNDGVSSIRTVKCKYKVVSKFKIMANYIYELASTEAGHEGEVFFRRRLPIPYFWDPGTQRFQPRFAKRFVRLYGLHREHSEFEFDGYFDAEIEKISRTGPMWKRHALGSYPDE